jgi:L-iditol 2-dehydrogenase
MGVSLHIIGRIAKYSDMLFCPAMWFFLRSPASVALEPAPAPERTPMKALRFYAPEDVRLEEVPEPVCGPDEIKLRVRNCSTCGTDVKIFHNGHQNLTPPRTIGHEVAGEVVEVGTDVNTTYGSDWQVGDRAQVIAAVPCGDCHECRKGWMAVCQNQTSVGYQYDGGFADLMIVPRQVLKVDGLNRIPDNVGFDEASAAEPFACAINAQELLGIEEGDTLVVFGAGPIGCMHIRIARGVHKVGPVYLVDVNADRLAMSAEAVDPDETINGAEVDVVARVMELTAGRGADVVITATAANVTQEQAIAMAARNGRISFFGGLPKTDPTITCDSNVVHYRQLHIHGANGSAPEHNKRALEYISTGQVPVKDLITRHVPLEDVLEAFSIVKNGEAIKVTVEP